MNHALTAQWMSEHPLEAQTGTTREEHLQWISVKHWIQINYQQGESGSLNNARFPNFQTVSITLKAPSSFPEHREWLKSFHVPETAILTDCYCYFFNPCQSQPLCAADTGCGAVAGSSVAGKKPPDAEWWLLIWAGEAKAVEESAWSRQKGVVTQPCTILRGRNLQTSGIFYVLRIFHNPNKLRGTPSSNCCELGAIQMQPQALVNYLGKYSFNLVLTPLETQEPNFCLQ